MLLLFRKKSIFNHPTITGVRFWPSNFKIGHSWSSNYQNRLYLAIWLFWKVVLLMWMTRGSGAHVFIKFFSAQTKHGLKRRPATPCAATACRVEVHGHGHVPTEPRTQTNLSLLGPVNCFGKKEQIKMSNSSPPSTYRGVWLVWSSRTGREKISFLYCETILLLGSLISLFCFYAVVQLNTSQSSCWVIPPSSTLSV